MYKGLYDCFSHWYDKGGSIWLYSDPHFSDDEMKYLRKNYIGDDEQIKRINSKIGKCDTIIFLGDIGNVDCIKRIRGKKILIKGNHDSGSENYRRVVKKVESNSDVCPVCGNPIKYDLTTLYNCGPEYAWCPTCEETVKPVEDKYTDNRLFDEVYEGPLFISEKIVLSHEPLDIPYALNIHGHDHSGVEIVDDHHINLCAEHIDYTPVCLKHIIESGVLKNVDSIHRATIDRATERSSRKSKI